MKLRTLFIELIETKDKSLCTEEKKKTKKLLLHKNTEREHFLLKLN